MWLAEIDVSLHSKQSALSWCQFKPITNLELGMERGIKMHYNSWYYCTIWTLYLAPFLNRFCVTPSKIVAYNRWKMRTKTITIQQLLPGLAWGEISVEIALTTVYSSCECLSPCWCHFSLQDLPRKECQFHYCTKHETFSLLNGNQTRWRLFSFDFWIWNEGLLIGWI